MARQIDYRRLAGMIDGEIQEQVERQGWGPAIQTRDSLAEQALDTARYTLDGQGSCGDRWIANCYIAGPLSSISFQAWIELNEGQFGEAGSEERWSLYMGMSDSLHDEINIRLARMRENDMQNDALYCSESEAKARLDEYLAEQGIEDPTPSDIQRAIITIAEDKIDETRVLDPEAYSIEVELELADRM